MRRRVAFLVVVLLGVCAGTARAQRRAGRAETAVKEIFRRAGIDAKDLVVKHPAFYRRLLSDPRLQFGETYMDGLWESPAIDRVITKMHSSWRKQPTSMAVQYWRTPLLGARAGILTASRNLRDALTNRQTRRLSKRVAEVHYDVGNELYRRMLDPTLTYTSGVWGPGYDLEDAQNAKYDLIARKLGLEPGQHVLDIGSGFGGFARFAARHYGAKVTGITISTEQLKTARALSANVDGVEFLYSDYRDLPHRFPPGTFDHVVSIEMIEAVGQKNLRPYFDAADSVLKPGGRFLIQGIASNRDVVNSNPWFSKYIFQDGVAPSTNQVDRAARASFGPPIDRHRITPHYDKTLLAWHDNFTRAWPALQGEYGWRFKRMWDFYLLSVAGGFRAEELQLYQSLYQKGGARPVAAPVRQLPGRARLDAMRASAGDIERTRRVIAEVEEERHAIARAAAPRSTLPRTPLARDARIAVIGAGPSGLSAARELKRRGYANVTVFEQAAEPGGKSHTAIFEGRPHDLGATMGVRGKYAEIDRLARETGQVTVPFPPQIHYDLERGGRAPSATTREFARLIQESVGYLIHRGLGDLEVPPAELADPWPVVMRRHGLARFGEQMKTYLTGYGYGGPETPAVYGERMLDAKAIVGAAVARPVMWRDGTQPIWRGVARGLDVRTRTRVSRVERGEAGVSLFVDGAAQPQRFDKLVMAVDPHAALGILDATPEEKALFSRVRHMPYATFAVRVENFAKGRAEVGYLKENMTLERQGRPMAWIKRYPEDDLLVVHLFAPPSIPDEQIVRNIAADLGRLGAGRVTLVDSRRWPFFPHVDAATIREQRFYERARNLQGQRDTVFVNEVLGMSTMADSAALGRKVAARLAAGEY